MCRAEIAQNWRSCGTDAWLVGAAVPHRAWPSPDLETLFPNNFSTLSFFNFEISYLKSTFYFCFFVFELLFSQSLLELYALQALQSEDMSEDVSCLEQRSFPT